MRLMARETLQNIRVKVTDIRDNGPDGLVLEGWQDRSINTQAVVGLQDYSCPVPVLPPPPHSQSCSDQHNMEYNRSELCKISSYSLNNLGVPLGYWVS